MLYLTVNDAALRSASTNTENNVSTGRGPFFLLSHIRLHLSLMLHLLCISFYYVCVYVYVLYIIYYIVHIILWEPG